MCGNSTLAVVVTTLVRGNKSVRAQYVDAVRRVVPTATVRAAVDGADQQGVADALRHDGVAFRRPCYTTGGWGMLALSVTRHRAFDSQRADYQVLLEDDLELLPQFVRAMRQLIGAHFCGERRVSGQLCTTNGRRHPCFQRAPDVIQLGSYGEGYITSRHGAQTLARKVREMGVRGCADQQYNVGALMNLTHVWNRRHVPWRRGAATTGP